MRLSVFALSALVAVSGCATGVYTPSLAEPVSNKAQFEKDVQECNAEQERRHEISAQEHSGDNTLMAATGLLGSAVVMSKSDTNDDYYKTPGEIIDECMTARGYKIAGQ